MKKNSVLVAGIMIAATALVAASISCSSSSTPAPNPASPQSKATMSPNAWQVPVDVFPPSPSPTPVPTQNDWLNLGWQTFIAIDWPALSPNSGGQMGQPDTNAMIGATAANGALVPAVWETYRDIGTVMLANGTDPGPQFNQPTAIPASCAPIGSNPVAPGFQPMLIDGSTFQQAAIVKDYINQATGNPLVDQEGWYTLTHILIDPSEYRYIQGNGYFQGSKQASDYSKNGKLAPFPRDGQGMGLPAWAQYGALEVKAAWRVLDPTEDQKIIPRYYTQWGYFMQPDGKTCQGPTLFGLIGLHILRLTPSTGATWFWATFEQVDNTIPPQGIPPTLEAADTPNGKCTTPPYNVGPKQITANIPWSGTNAANNLCQVTLLPSDVVNANKQWQQQLQGTVWQYYQMVDTLNPCSPGDSSCSIFPPLNDTNNKVNLNVFANTAIESYYQTHSCMDCHGYAEGDGAPSQFSSTNQIFTFVLQNAYWTGSAAKAKHERFLRLFRNPPRGKLVAMPGTREGEDKYKK
jgi:hypothetical protein